MFKKGEPKPPNSGRKKGLPNKTTLAAKEAFQLAFDEIGGAQGLAKWALANPTDFYKIYGRLIPVDTKISGNLTLGELVEASAKASVPTT